jgi:hypothetical protein
MELKKEIKDLTEQQKKELKEAKTKEELNALVSPAGFELSDDELDAAAAGRFDPDCPCHSCWQHRGCPVEGLAR